MVCARFSPLVVDNIYYEIYAEIVLPELSEEPHQPVLNFSSVSSHFIGQLALATALVYGQNYYIRRWSQLACSTVQMQIETQFLVSSEMLSNSILESPNFQNFLWGHATRPPSCDILCMQVLFVQFWNKLCILQLLENFSSSIRRVKSMDITLMVQTKSNHLKSCGSGPVSCVVILCMQDLALLLTIQYTIGQLKFRNTVLQLCSYIRKQLYFIYTCICTHSGGSKIVPD